MTAKSSAVAQSGSEKASIGPRRMTTTDALRQVYLYAKGFFEFGRGPTSRATFTALSEALVRLRVNHDFVEHVMRDPAVADLVRERYVGRSYDPELLIQYPPGSLGHELAAAMLKHGYDPEFYRDYYGDRAPEFTSDEEYLRFRVRQTHDIVHVLTGFDMIDFPEELGMQAFLAAQTHRPFSIALLGFGFLRIILKPEELSRTLHQVAKGFAIGYRAKSLLGQRFEEDWTKPVADWRRELGLVEEAAFDFRAAEPFPLGRAPSNVSFVEQDPC